MRQTPRVGHCLPLLPIFDSVLKMDINLRRTLSTGPKAVRLRKITQLEYLAQSTVS